MKRCHTCKFWISTGNDLPFRDKSIGKCTNNKISEDDNNDLEYRKANKQDMLIYEYSEGGRFFTGRYFGCVHHKDEIQMPPFLRVND